LRAFAGNSFRMNSSATINTDALGPLFTPWEEPNAHRVRAEKEGDPAKVVKQRRPSPIVVAQHIRAEVRQWREASYFHKRSLHLVFYAGRLNV